ncbi:MAG: phosphate ABC transporter ATP-binding protein PstB [bacterium]
MNKVSIKNLSFYFEGKKVLNSVNLDVAKNKILAIIGPSGGGKTTLLRLINRLEDTAYNTKKEGNIFIDDKNIYSDDINVSELRRRVGMVFAQPIPLPRSIYENIIYGPRLAGIVYKKKLDELVEKSLRQAFLWDEVNTRLNRSALSLSGGQKQRLCIARTLALQPEILLLDEPCSSLDPVSTAKIEEAMLRLKEKYTIIIVTNNTKQAARVADDVAFLLMGELIEYGESKQIFTVPKDKRTDDYITGRFG